MKSELEKLVLKFQPALQRVLDAGFYEVEDTVAGFTCTLHVLVKDEMADSSKRAGEMCNNDILTRQHFLNIWLMAHAYSIVQGVKFADVKEAFDFFKSMSEQMFELWMAKYNEIIPKGKEQIDALVQGIKNSPGVQKDGASGSDSPSAVRNETGGLAVPEMDRSRRK